MDTDDHARTALWRDIDALLAQARDARPLHCADALLDLTRMQATACSAALLPRLAEALEGWTGQLLVGVPDDELAPTLRAGDRLVVDGTVEPGQGDVVVALVGGMLVVRRLTWCGGQQWLASNRAPSVPLGPMVAIVGTAVELRRTLAAMRGGCSSR